MENENDRAAIPGYVSIKEAARMLGISANRVYAYVEEGRLPSAKAAHVIMIPLEAVEDFKPQLSGRPRASVPTWRISPEENTILATSIFVHVRPGQRARLVARLEDMRREKRHLFPGTLARFIIEKQRQAESIEIVLLWRESARPDEATYQHWLGEFQRELQDVVEWETAEYDLGSVLMHT